MKYPLLIPMIGHGATDIIDYPIKSIYLNLITGLLIYPISINKRKIILIASSIFHIAQDIPLKLKYLYSSLIHILWIKFPLISKLNLLLIHTPLHYKKLYMTKNYKFKYLTGILTSFVSKFFLDNNLDLYLNKLLGDLWWLSFVLSHIILTHLKY